MMEQIIEIDELKALEREAYVTYRQQVRRGANSHDDFFVWQGLKEQLQALGGECYEPE